MRLPLIPVLLPLIPPLSACAAQPLLPAVETQETVYTYEPANNGAGPLWCYGSTCIARIGEDVFVSGLETIKDQEPLNNTRWMLFRRGRDGWELQQADPEGRTREGCPIAAFPDGRLFISANPTLTAPDAYSGPAQPQVLQFSAPDPTAPPQVLLPTWEEAPAFTEHSYRGFAADGPGGELLLLNIQGHEAQHWSFRDREGDWSPRGKLVFPMGTDYEVPEPIRLCYPVVALKSRAAHVLAISDIIEPVKAWREYKLELNEGRAWDYDFRRLFYTWTPDITGQAFSDWIEIASREQTAGHITNLDMWVDEAGRAYLLWLDRSVWDTRVRDKFFPDEPQTISLDYCIVDKGHVVHRGSLATGGEGIAGEVPGYARFQATADGRLFVFYYCSGTAADGRAVSENRVVEVFPDGSHGDAVSVALAAPFTSFMTASERGGSPPSSVLEVLGVAGGMPGLSYARINLLGEVRAEFTSRVSQDEAGARAELDGTPSVSARGKVTSWRWDVGGQKASGPRLTHLFRRSGPVDITLTVEDDLGHRATIARTVQVPPTPSDLGLQRWGTVVRTQAGSYVFEAGGEIHVRSDKLGAGGLSLSHWNTQGHRLEWEVDLPAGDWHLVARYATPENATRSLSIDGRQVAVVSFPSSGGYGSAITEDWAFAVLADPAGKPLALHLEEGRHNVCFENPDGTGLNLDYLDWVAQDPATPPPGLTRVVEEAGYRYSLPQRGVLVAGRIRPEIGNCYTYELGPQYPGDGVPEGPPSRLRLLEDGRELGPAHVPHVDVREQGLGRYSHWGLSLWFSTSDNTDPRDNGRRYAWEIVP